MYSNFKNNYVITPSHTHPKFPCQISCQLAHRFSHSGYAQTEKDRLKCGNLKFNYVLTIPHPPQAFMLNLSLQLPLIMDCEIIFLFLLLKCTCAIYNESGWVKPFNGSFRPQKLKMVIKFMQRIYFTYEPFNSAFPPQK